MNSQLKISIFVLITAFTLSACNQKASTEEVAAQVKIALDAEKAKNAEIASQVKQAVDEEKAKEAAARAEEHKTADTKTANAKVAETKTIESKKAVESKKTVTAKPVQEESATVAPLQAIAKPLCANCGTVIAVNMFEEAGKGSGAGVIAGGLVGGLLGNQVGQGTGKDVATLAGVVGGALAGNAIEKNAKKTKSYNIVVKMDDGTERTYRQATAPSVMSGDKVKIENDTVVKN